MLSLTLLQVMMTGLPEGPVGILKAPLVSATNAAPSGALKNANANVRTRNLPIAPSADHYCTPQDFLVRDAGGTALIAVQSYSCLPGPCRNGDSDNWGCVIGLLVFVNMFCEKRCQRRPVRDYHGSGSMKYKMGSQHEP